MTEYHKIQTVFKRDPATKHKNLLIGDYSLPEFEYLKNNAWIFTEKVDGTNIRVMFDGQSVKFGGKTEDAQIPAVLVGQLEKMFLIQFERFKEKFGTEAKVCLYGEGYGAKIQKGGGSYRPDQSFVLFDVLIDSWWLQRADVQDVAKFFGLDVVPMIGQGTLVEMVDQTKAGFKSQWGNFMAEGIVARPKTELKTRSGHRVITKIKHKDF